jgi:putative heme iron utilization protein
MTMKLHRFAVVLGISVGLGGALLGFSGVADAAAPCATAAQIETVRAALTGKEPGPLGGVAATLKLPESLVASALPAAQAHGVGSEHFAQVWKSLESWDDALTFITKGRDLFEVKGRVGKGEPSKRSKFFNLTRDGDGLIGHLRPDLYSAIYALSIPGEKSTLRGVTFFDQAGESVFSVYVPGEGGEAPPPAVIKQFEATAKIMRGLPSLCPR